MFSKMTREASFAKQTFVSDERVTRYFVPLEFAKFFKFHYLQISLEPFVGEKICLAKLAQRRWFQVE